MAVSVAVVVVAACSGNRGVTGPPEPGPGPGDALPAGDLSRNSDANPILRNGPEVYDEAKAGPRSVLKAGPGDYRVWYEAVRDDSRLTTTVAYATSPDGEDWTKHPDNPVMRATEPWEGPEVSPTTVLRDEETGTYQLWYHGGGNDAPRKIGYATSPDGLTWTRHAANPVLEPGPPGSWDDRYVADVKVIRRGPDDYLAWYKGVRDSDGRAQVGLATSSDGISWTKHPSNPVFSPSSSGWDRGSIQGVGVHLNRSTGVFHMWYPADTDLPFDGDDGIGYACSDDGVRWRRGPDNPVLAPNPDPDAPDHQLGDTMDVYLDRGTYRITYGAFNFSRDPVLRGIAEATVEAPAREAQCGG